MIARIVERLLGNRAMPASADDKGIAGDTAPSGGITTVVPPSHPLVHRDEILDRRARIAGYRFRTLSLAGRAPSAREKSDALKCDNLPLVTEHRMAVVQLEAADWQGEDYRQFATPNTIFQVAPPPGGAIGPWLDSLRAMKADGARIGLDDAVAETAGSDVLRLADAIFVRPGDQSVEALDRRIEGLRRCEPHPLVIADGVHSWDDYRTCLGVGADCCLGDFAVTPDEDRGDDGLPQSRIILIEMLNLLRTDAELAQLAAMAKRDAGVAVKLLEMSNSPLFGLASGAASIDQAIMLLGRESLYRWLAMAIFRAGSGRGVDETLLEVALCRARFMELLGMGRLGQKESDELFVVGLVSVMDKLLHIPMERVLERMALPRRIADALIHREGPYARFLTLAIAVEEGAIRGISRMAGALDLDMELIADSTSAARAWADQSVSLA